MTLSSVTRLQLDQTVQASCARSLVASQPPARSGLGLPSLISPTQPTGALANPYTVLSDDALGPGDDLQCFKREFASDCTSDFDDVRCESRPSDLDINLPAWTFQSCPGGQLRLPRHHRTIILRPRQQVSFCEINIAEVYQAITANIPEELASTADYDITVLRRSNTVAVDTQNDSFIQALLAISILPLRFTVQPYKIIQKKDRSGMLCTAIQAIA